METNTTKIAHCNICGGKRNHKIRDSVQKRYSEEDHYGVTWGDDYFFLQCLGCDNVKILHESWCSEWADHFGNLPVEETYYPSSIFRRQPDWLLKLNEDWHITKMQNAK